MKRLIAGILLGTMALCAVAVIVPAVYAKDGEMKEVLHHNVLFRYKAAVTEEEKQEVVKRFAALKEKIPSMLTFCGGKNIEGEHLSDGFEYAFTATFPGTAERDAYLVDPAHKDFGKFVGPLIDKVIVADFMGPAN